MPPRALSVGIVPMPAFTMIAFAGFVDTLRLAGDEGDRSRPDRCRWTVLGERRAPVRASNGVVIHPDEDLRAPERFDYIAVVGGTLHAGPHETPALLAFLRTADAAGVPLVGLCTGSFTLARAGLMEGRTTCVNWFHHDDFRAEFPDSRAVSDRLFVEDKRRITCAGGVSVIHVASALVERHLGSGAGDKGRRIMLEEPNRDASQPQPLPHGLALAGEIDPRVGRAILLMERRMADRPTTAQLAAAAGVAPRTLQRLFVAATGLTPGAVLRRLRLVRACALLARHPRPKLDSVAAECGFADGSHVSRALRASVEARGQRVQQRPTHHSPDLTPLGTRTLPA